MRLDAENIDDVGVANLRQRAALVQQPILEPRVAHSPMQDLDGHVPLELRVPRPVDAAVAAFPDLVGEAVLSPGVERRSRRGSRRRRIRQRRVLVVHSGFAMHVDDVVEQAKTPGPLPLARRRGLLDGIPVNGETVGNLLDGVVENSFRHAASPPPDASSRA